MARLPIIVPWLWVTLMTSSATLAREQIRYSLSDETPALTSVGFIATDSGMARELEDKQFRSLTYRIWKEPEEFSGYFGVNPESGLLTTLQHVDRDTVCTGLTVCQVELLIQITGTVVSLVRILPITIHIDDANDNLPTFKEQSVELVVSEGASIGTRFDLPHAFDSDSPTYGIYRYELVQQADTATTGVFELIETKAGDVDELFLSLIAPLDRETLDTYRMKLVVYDKSFNKSHSSSIDITVTVTDTNDNVPRFIDASYSVVLPEDTEPGSEVVRVHATDPDAGSNGHVTYAIDRKSTDGADRFFSLNPVSGVVAIAESLDYDTKSSFTLVISARDGGLHSNPSFTRVFIKVLDVNDNRPLISLRSTDDRESDIFHISEGISLSGFVAHLTVQDADSNSFGLVTCTLNESHFRLDKLFSAAHSTQFIVSTAVPLDRETISEYDVTVKCVDGGSTPLTGLSLFSIFIDDENDNHPQFKYDIYIRNLVENNVIGSTIISVSAKDEDLGENAKILYTFTGPCEGLKIDSNSGLISASLSFDREKTEKIYCRVLALNPGESGVSSSGASSETLVEIEIIDEDDELPTFNQTHYIFRIDSSPEPSLESSLELSLQAGTEVGRVVAVDADSDLYNVFTYEIDNNRTLNTCNLSVCFTISPKTGRIYLSADISSVHEVGQRFELTVVAVPSNFQHSIGTNLLQTIGTSLPHSTGTNLSQISNYDQTPNRAKVTIILQSKRLVEELRLILSADKTDKFICVTQNLVRGDIIARVKKSAPKNTTHLSPIVFSLKSIRTLINSERNNNVKACNRSVYVNTVREKRGVDNIDTKSDVTDKDGGYFRIDEQTGDVSADVNFEKIQNDITFILTIAVTDTLTLVSAESELFVVVAGNRQTSALDGLVILVSVVTGSGIVVIFCLAAIICVVRRTDVLGCGIEPARLQRSSTVSGRSLIQFPRHSDVIGRKCGTYYTNPVDIEGSSSGCQERSVYVRDTVGDVEALGDGLGDMLNNWTTQSAVKEPMVCGIVYPKYVPARGVWRGGPGCHLGVCQIG